MLTIKLLMLYSRTKGFTVVELLIVIIIIGILATVATFAYNGTTQRSVNTQLMTDLTEASDLLETDYVYKKQYPTLASDANSGNGLKLTPGTNINYVVGSVDKDNDWFCVEAASDRSGTKQYFIVSGAKVVEGTCPEAPSIQLSEGPAIPATPVVNASTAGTTTDWTWDDATCNIGTAKYEYVYSDNGAASTPATTTTTTISFNTPTEGHTYNLEVRARCEDGAAVSGWSDYGSQSYTRSTAPASPTTPTTPAAPIVSASTPATTTTWTWGVATCNLGAPMYEYTYSTSASAGSAVATTATSISFNTATQGYTYTVKVRARCENGTEVSAWSAYGSKAYSRPITNTVQVASGSTSLYIPNSDSYQINGRATVNGITGSCASGTRAVVRYRTQLNQATPVDRGSYVNYASGWTVYYGTDLDLNDMLEFMFYARCYNATTGLYGPSTYSDAYGNGIVTQNRLRPDRGTWRRGCEGHNSNPTQAGWCTVENKTFMAFP